MQYLLLIYAEESIDANMSEADQAQLLADYETYTQELIQAGALRGGEALVPTSAATTVRVRGSETLTTDGPFAETKEALGGFYLIEVGTEAEALEWAAKIPSAKYGCVEVRPILKYD